MKKKITAVDMYCGAGGTTAGLRRACEQMGKNLQLFAINHWDKAIASHKKNHPEAKTLCANVDAVNPRQLVPDGLLDILVASPECFPADTLILTDGGLIPIQNVQVGMRVLTHQGRWQPVTRTMRTVKDTVIVRGHGHFGLETTAEHPFWTRERRKRWPKGQRNGVWTWSDPEWKPASESKDLFWATPTSVPTLPVPMPEGFYELSPEFWWVVGRWLGDGSVSLRPSKGGEITVSCGDHEADDLAPRLQQGWPQVRWTQRRTRTATLFECRNTALALWLNEHCGKLAHGKMLPPWALGMLTENRAALLEGYLSADGHFDGRKQELTTVSKSLAVGIRLLAESLGNRAALHRAPQHCSEIEGRQLNVRDVHRVMWVRDRRRNYSTELDGAAWSRVRSVGQGRQSVEVFNLSVAEDESYVADGIIVHNCTHHSNAAGGRPKNEQSRASAWRIVEWASQIDIAEIEIENVPEFQTWGPLTAAGRPNKRLKGATYIAFLNALRSLNYTVEARVLCAADYGDPTTRERLFIRASRRRGPIIWPEPTHAAKEALEDPPLLNGGKSLMPHRPVAEVIDWTIPSQSIFTRKRPLRPNTLRRIFKGIEKFSGLPFIVPQLSGGAPRSTDRPLQTITTTSRGIGLCEPFIVELRKNKSARSINDPLSTVCGSGAHHGLCEPFIIPLDHGGNDSRCYPIDRPMKTVTSFDGSGLVNPWLIAYYGTAIGQGIDKPLRTVTVKDRFGLVQPVIEADGAKWKLDIKFRMLQPSELAGAQGFPEGYAFEGTREDQVKQIGNAVPVNLATALAGSILNQSFL